MTHTENAFINIRVTRFIPEKGDIIDIDAFGDGNIKRFRILKIDGLIATLIALDSYTISRFNTSSRTATFDNSSDYQNYADSILDTTINNTYYNSLTANVKTAIIPVNRVQSCYKIEQGRSDTADFNIVGKSTFITSYNKVTQKNIGERYCYAIDFDDVKEYFGWSTGDLAIYSDIWDTFSDESQIDIWTATASTATSHAGNISHLIGLGDSEYSYNGRVNPAFKIDLTYVNFTIEQ